MKGSSVINEILRLHGQYSQAAVSTDDPDEVFISKTKAGAMQDLIDGIYENVIHDPDKKNLFIDAINNHFASFGKQLFWNRNVNLED